jgi:predicted dehydrogenase
MALNLEQADEMIAVADHVGKILMIGLPHRYRKSMQIFKMTLTSGRYGRLFMLDSLMDESLQKYTSGWIARKATLGGGVFFSASTHMLDVMLWIAGDVQAISMVGTRAGGGTEGEDTAASVLKFKNGVIGVTRHTWASPKSRIWYSMHAMCEKAHITLTTTPLGDLARESVQCRWSTTIISEGKTQEVILQNGEGLDLAPEIDHFFHCIATGTRPSTDGHAGRELIRLVLQAYSKAEAEGGNA